MDCYANNAYSCFGILNRHLDLLMSNSIKIQVKMNSSEMKKGYLHVNKNSVCKEYNIWTQYITLEGTYFSLLVFWPLLNILPKFCLKFATHIQFRRVNLKSTLWIILVIVEGILKGRFAQQHVYKIDFILTCRKPRCVVINRCRRSLYQRAYFMTETVKIINIEIINFQFIN